MEAVLRLEYRQEVVYEGWLVKRPSQKSSTENSFLPKSFAGDSAKKRYFVLLRTKGLQQLKQKGQDVSAEIVYFMKQPKIKKYDGGSPVIIRKSKSQRSFPGGMPTLEDLREKKTGLVSGVFKNFGAISLGRRSGTIPLSAEDQVFLEQGKMLRLQAGGVVNLLEVSGASSTAEGSMILGQWLQAIRQSISLLAQAARQKDFENMASYTFYSPAVMGRGKGEETNQVALPQNFTEVLEKKVLRDEFEDYLTLWSADENLLFYEAAVKYKKQIELLCQKRPVPRNRDFEIAKAARQMYDKYIKQGGETWVNVSAACREQIERKMEEYKEKKKAQDNLSLSLGNSEDATVDQPEGLLSPDLFMEAQNEVFLLMEANFFHGFYKELGKRTGCFSNLVYRYELIGYDVVAAQHFGSVKTEMDRLINRFESRHKEVKVEIKAIQEQLLRSHEIVVPQLETSYKALDGLYELEKERLIKLEELEESLRPQVTSLKNRSVTVQHNLKTVRDGDDEKITAYNQLAASKKLISKFKDLFDENYADYQKKHITAEEFVQKMKNDKITVDNIETIRTETEVKFQSFCTSVAKTKDQLKQELTRSLDELEKVDLRRLTAQQDISKKILQAQHTYADEMKDVFSRFEEVLNDINPEADVSSFAQFIIGSLQPQES